jgi:hypothetical protein
MPCVDARTRFVRRAGACAFRLPARTSTWPAPALTVLVALQIELDLDMALASASPIPPRHDHKFDSTRRRKCSKLISPIFM